MFLMEFMVRHHHIVISNFPQLSLLPFDGKFRLIQRTGGIAEHN